MIGRWLVVPVVAGMLLGACTKDAPQSAGDRASETVSDGTIGAQVNLFGIMTTVVAIDSFDQSPGGFPRLRLTMRTENTTSTIAENPNVALHCDEAKAPGDWYLGSTWEANGLLPAGTVNEGQVVIGFPAKEGTTRYPVPSCTNAVVLITGVNPRDRTQSSTVRYPVPATTIDASIAALRGPGLPLRPRNS